MSAHCGKARRFGVFAAAALATLAGTAVAQPPVYRTGFGDGAGNGWSAARVLTSPTGNKLLGRFHNEPVTLTLDSLPRHSSLVVAMDVHIIGKWTGESRPGKPATTLTITLDDGTLLSSSFANDDGDPSRRQSFPDEPNASDRPAALGAYRLNALGLLDDSGKPEHDSVYRLVFAAPHNAGSMKLTLSASNLPGSPKDASWAVDNAVVYAAPENADLDAIRAAARDAVNRTALGIGGSFAVPEATPAGAPALRLPSSPAPTGWNAGPIGNLGAFEASMRPAVITAHDSILANAMDGESRATFLPRDERALSIGLAQDLALVSERYTAEFAAPAPAARPELPVTRRVSALVYQSRFNEAPGAQWDNRAHGIAPHGERFIGPFVSQPATLTLSDIPEHDQLIIDADFYAIGDWAGDAPDPSKFTFTVDGQPVLDATFANEDGSGKRTQTYPAAASARPRLPGTDSTALDALGFPALGKDAVGDSTYHLRFVVPHSKGAAALKFAASGLGTSGTVGAWGLDNVTIVSSGDRTMSYSDATGVEPDDNADDGDYMNPFVRAPGSEWNVQKFETSPSGEMFLGRLHNQTASLTVKNFPQHTHMVLAADVVVVGDWQGNAPDPSKFSIKLSDGTVVLATSFATDGGASDATQDYPGGSNGRNLPGAGAAAVGSMGYKDAKTGVARDAVYRLAFTIPHTAAKETISFTVSGLRGDESKASWGLDNVSVSTFDAANPAGYAAGGGNTALGDAGALASGNPSGGTIGGYSRFDPLGNNPYIPPTKPGEFPHLPDGGGGGGGGGGPPVAPAPGTLPAILVGAAVAARRNRRS